MNAVPGVETRLAGSFLAAVCTFACVYKGIVTRREAAMKLVFATLFVLMNTLLMQGQTKPGAKAASGANPQTSPARPAASPSASKTEAPSLTIDEIVAMLEAKLPEEIIAMKVKQNDATLPVSTAQLIALKKAGSSASLLAVIMDPKRDYEAPKSLEVPVAKESRPVQPSVSNGDVTPTLEMGMYIRKAGKWVEVAPEVVNWKTGGTLKSLASAGVVKKDLNGNVDGPSSKNSVKTPVEILLVTAEGINATEYQLLRLRVNKDYREFRSVTGGILNQRGGAMRDLIPFESKKVAPRQFEFVVPASLGAGEYGVLPPGAGGTSTTSAVSSSYGKLYTFHIVE
jgi:hypothetical protein